MVKLGLDPCQPDLKQAREYFASLTVEQYIDQVLELANVSELVMTNDPFNPVERAMWERNEPCPERFHRALRMDPVLNDWETAHAVMAAAGFKTSADLTPQTVERGAPLPGPVDCPPAPRLPRGFAALHVYLSG